MHCPSRQAGSHAGIDSFLNATLSAHALLVLDTDEQIVFSEGQGSKVMRQYIYIQGAEGPA